jgi:hypothetical protein
MIFAATAGCAAPPSAELARNPDRHIYVTSDPRLLGQCYRDLGTINFRQSFADAATDPDGSKMKAQMGALALARYPNDVDAVINLHTNQNEIGTALTVSGEAVAMEPRGTLACELNKAY